MASQLTKQALEESLKRLLLKKPLSKITIADLTADCGVSRMTFYYHFQDIYDLVEWSCRQDAAAALAGNDTADTWQLGLLGVLGVLRDNKPLVLNVYRDVTRPQVEGYLLPVARSLLMSVIGEKSAGMGVRPADREFVADFYKHAFVGVLLDWVADDMREEPEDLARRVGAVMAGQVVAALERLASPRHPDPYNPTNMIRN